VIRDSNVGYIDPAIPGDVIRFRYDAAYDNRQPSRAEFFWPQSGPTGPGPPQPESSVDYQDFSLYGETLLLPRWSAFLDVPVRLVNPEINDNAAGFSDLNAGIKYAFIDCPDLVTTAQLRVYAPTGNAFSGLGTRHVSLEPALLVYQPLGDRLCFEGELRYWVPIGGTDFSGSIIRYGAGLHTSTQSAWGWQMTPVLEVVGWTVLDGMSSAQISPGVFALEDAAGTTVINAKLGVRTCVGNNADIYAGYGQPLTGDTWYENTFRIELRWFY
jgi:hypothetical protein